MATKSLDPEKAHLYDKRTVHRNIKKGLLSRKEYESYLAALPDVSDKIAPAEPAPLDDSGIEAASAPSSRIDLLPGTPVSPEAIAAVTGGTVGALGKRVEAWLGAGPEGDSKR